MVEGQHLVGLIGAGIGASLSPALHEREAARRGLPYEYRLLDIEELGAEPQDLLETARQDRWSGLNVTHPCKRELVDHLDELSPAAAQLDAVNTVVFDEGRAVGHNTDTTGFAESFARGLPNVGRESVVLLGAGGAGAAVGHAALELGVRELSILDVDPSRAAALASRLGAQFKGRKVAPGRDLKAELQSATGLIHCTPTGMAGHAGIPLDEKLLRPVMWVSDIVYVPLETELLKAAKRAGCRIMDGGHMNVGQAIGGFHLFTGRDADPARMDGHFRSL
jgi:shikimate dehydrogenase